MDVPNNYYNKVALELFHKEWTKKESVQKEKRIIAYSYMAAYIDS